MAMIYTLDTLSRRYGLLPSDCMMRATTFDLVIMDAAMGYERHVNDRQQGNKPQAPKPDQATMQAMLERVRGRQNK